MWVMAGFAAGAEGGCDEWDESEGYQRLCAWSSKLERYRWMVGLF